MTAQEAQPSASPPRTAHTVSRPATVPYIPATAPYMMPPITPATTGSGPMKAAHHHHSHNHTPTKASDFAAHIKHREAVKLNQIAGRPTSSKKQSQMAMMQASIMQQNNIMMMQMMSQQQQRVYAGNHMAWSQQHGLHATSPEVCLFYSPFYGKTVPSDGKTVSYACSQMLLT
jgi:hypothetical protein